MDLCLGDGDLEDSTAKLLSELHDGLLDDEELIWLQERDKAALSEDAEGHILIAALAYADGPDPVAIRCVVGRGWIVTAHTEQVDLIELLNEPISSQFNLGRMDGPRFLAVLMDWHLSTFFDRVEQLDREVDDLDEQLIAPEFNRQDRELMDRLIDLRHRVGRLRRTVVDHRELLTRLADPELIVLSNSESAHRFAELTNRLETAVGSIDSTRSAITGSLEIFMSRTEQRTNDVMKVLTVISAVLMPATVIAGVLGMNFELGFFSNLVAYWIVLGAMLAIAAGTLVAAHRRGWIGGPQ
ncbi:hypothetical protein GCM10009547_44450 [Sporichthya brevicatena]|uniref:Magnesium transporter n=1 Tax=Sporichthya brevicatena TaxID=171442 RepID=A0ABN1HAA1_9ACTN